MHFFSSLESRSVCLRMQKHIIRMGEKYDEELSNLQTNIKETDLNCYSKSNLLNNVNDESSQDRETLISNILSSSGSSQMTDGTLFQLCKALELGKKIIR